MAPQSAWQRSSEHGEVLPGPKYPTWGCKCGMDGNWASRISCRGCSSPASRSTQNAAEQAAAKHKAAADASQRGSAWSRGGAGGGGNGSGNGGGNKAGDHDIALLKKQVAELLRSNKALQSTVAASRQPQPEDASMEEDQLPSMDSLRKLLQANEDAYGKQSEQALSCSSELERVRRAHTGVKPVLTQVQIAQRVVEKHRKQVRTLEASLAALEKQLSALQGEVSTATTDLQQAREKERLAECEAVAVCQRALPDGGAAAQPAFHLEAMLSAIRSKAPLAASCDGGPEKLEQATQVISEFVAFVNRAEDQAAAQRLAQQAAQQPVPAPGVAPDGGVHVPVPGGGGEQHEQHLTPEEIVGAMQDSLGELDAEKRKALIASVAEAQHAKRQKSQHQG